MNPPSFYTRKPTDVGLQKGSPSDLDGSSEENGPQSFGFWALLAGIISGLLAGILSEKKTEMHSRSIASMGTALYSPSALKEGDK